MMEEERTATRERVREWRRSDRSKRDSVTEYTSVTTAAAAHEERAATAPRHGSASIHETDGSHVAKLREGRSTLAPSERTQASRSSEDRESGAQSTSYEPTPTTAPAPVTGYSRVTADDVTRYTSVTTGDVTEYEHGNDPPAKPGAF